MVKSAKVAGDGVNVQVEARDGGAVKSLRADVVLVAVGVTGNVESLGLEEIGVKIDRGFLTVDDNLQTGDQGRVRRSAT